MIAKYTKLVVKDANGDIIQLLPEIQVDSVLNANSDRPISNSAVASALSSSSKSVGISTTEPNASNSTSLKNESMIFWNQGASAQGPLVEPVLTTGNQTIEGQKKFLCGLYGGVYAMGSAEWAFDLTKATCFTKTATSSGTFSFTNVPSATCCCITVILKNGGNYTVRWPSSVKWSEDTTPTLTASGTDVFTFITCDGGTVWYGTTTCISVTA